MLIRPSRRSLITGAAALAAAAALPGIGHNSARAGLNPYRRPFHPGDLNSSGNQVIAAWWRARDKALMTDDGSGLISSWSDRCSGLAVTASTTARPTWASNSFNSAYPGITFDGVANCLVTTSLGGLPAGATAGFIVLVGSVTSPGAANGRLFEYGTSGAGTRGVRQGVAGRYGVSDGTTTIGLSSPSFNPFVLYGDWSGTTENGYANGTALPGSPATIGSLNTGTTRARMGAASASGASNFTPCVISDILVGVGTLSTADRQRIEGYFPWNRGFSSSLPSNHPYKGAPP